MARKKRPITDADALTATVPQIDSDPGGAGQAGDLQGLPDEAGADSQSVRELAEDGQYFEAALVDAVENAPPADAGELTTREVPEDDVPPEYTDQDRDEPQE
jgi:hypothetical protein